MIVVLKRKKKQLYKVYNSLKFNIADLYTLKIYLYIIHYLTLTT